MSGEESKAETDWRHDGWPSDFTREQLITAHFANDRADKGDNSLFWAWQAVEETVREGDVDEAWQLVLDLVAKAPDPMSLGLIGAGALEDLLWRAGDELIDRVEVEAPTNPRLREAISSVWIGTDHVAQQTVDRLHAVADSDPGNWTIAESGIPEVAVELLASDRIDDRRWGAKQLHYASSTPATTTLLLKLLHSGDEDLRETAAQKIAYSREPEFLTDLIDELDKHPGVDGGRGLAWSVNWLAYHANENGQRNAHEALMAFAARGDKATERHVEELLNPGLAKSRLHNGGQQIVTATQALLDAQEAEGQDVSGLREAFAKLQVTVDKLDEGGRS